MNKIKMGKMSSLVKFLFLTSFESGNKKKWNKKKDDLLGMDNTLASESIPQRIMKYVFGIFLSFLSLAIILAIQGYGGAKLAIAQGYFAENLTSMMFAMFLMSTMYGLLMYSNTMYYDKKADFLSVLPVSRDQIFWAKFIFLYVNQVPVAFILFLPLAYASAAAAGLKAGGYLILTIIPFFVPMLALFLSTIISLPMNYIVSKSKSKERTKNIFLGVLSLIMIIPVIAFIAISSSSEDENQLANLQNSMQGAMKGLSYVIYPIYAFVKASTFEKGSGLMILYTILIFIAITVLTFVLSKLLYAKATTNLEDVGGVKKIKKEEKPVKGKMSILIKREEKRLLKLPGNSINILVGIAMPFFMLVPALAEAAKEMGGVGNMYKTALAAGLTNTLSGVSMGMCFFAMAMAMVYVNLSFMVPISSEHRTGINYLLSLPISLEELVKAKILTNLKFSVLLNIPLLLFFIALSPILKFATIVLLINGVLIALSMISIIYLVDLSKPYLDWTNVAETRQKFRSNIPLMLGILIAMVQLPVAMPIAIFTFELLHSYIVLYVVITVFNVIIFLIPFLLLKKNIKKYLARLQA
ncbi:MAG TPA: hypothetical protein PKX91_04875 [Clostridia bacterium]|jgi:ABC-2 type transport system permease protein|nr:hypothetical protein [Clostridia bacterium]